MTQQRGDGVRPHEGREAAAPNPIKILADGTLAKILSPVTGRFQRVGHISDITGPSLAEKRKADAEAERDLMRLHPLQKQELEVWAAPLARARREDAEAKQAYAALVAADQAISHWDWVVKVSGLEVPYDEYHGPPLPVYRSDRSVSR